MRNALRDYLSTHCASITVWRDPYVPTKSTPKPYGVIVVGDTIQSPSNRRGFFLPVYVWPYLDGRSFTQLDEVVAEIRGLLQGKGGQPKVLTSSAGNRFEIEWVSEGRDFYDDDLDAITRRLEFRVPRIR